MENLVMTMALGGRIWGDFALNLGLSIKAMHPKAKTALIYQESAVDGLQDLEIAFDVLYRVQDGGPQTPEGGFVTAHEHAFYLKTQLYDIAQKIAPEAQAYIFLDADVIMQPGRSVDEWFREHKGRAFTCWNNGYYSFENKAYFGKGYTFWCEPEEVKAEFGRRNSELESDWISMPQTNSSFLYFEKGPSGKALYLPPYNYTVETLFEVAKNVWRDKDIGFKPYKGVKPDELCFNMACAATGIMPHQFPYYPIFFQFASEHHEETYIQHGWPALGFAGEGRQTDHIVRLYNKYVAYYRALFDIDEEFVFDNRIKTLQDSNPLRIEPVRKRTLYRRGDVKGSGGGIFNPSGLDLGVAGQLTLYRKEANHNIKVGYTTESAVPHLHILSSHEEVDIDLPVIGFDGQRVEDFRLFRWNGALYASHTVVNNNLSERMTASMAISKIERSGMKKVMDVQLPIPVKSVEKNWGFFEHNRHLWCVYSLNPYRLFKFIDSIGWVLHEVRQPELKWFHYGQFICNSTNPIPLPSPKGETRAEHYLMFSHSKENGVYHHGAVLLDGETLEITHYTRNSIIVKEPQYTEGMAKGIVYVSGCCYIQKLEPRSKNQDGVVRVFFGEADSGSCYVDYDAAEFLMMMKKYPL